MKICITAEGDSLECRVDSRFGRCKKFIIIDTDSGHFEVEKNPNTEFPGGAGIQSAQFMNTRKIKAILTGNLGPNACETLKAAGIDFYTGVTGTVKEALEMLKSGKLQSASGPSASEKSGHPVPVK